MDFQKICQDGSEHKVITALSYLADKNSLDTFFNSFKQEKPFHELTRLDQCKWEQYYNQAKNFKNISEEKLSDIKDVLSGKADYYGLPDIKVYPKVYPFDDSEKRMMFRVVAMVPLQGQKDPVEFDCFCELTYSDYFDLLFWYDEPDEEDVLFHSIEPAYEYAGVAVNDEFVEGFFGNLKTNPPRKRKRESESESE
jgi:hypothetical protein